MITKTIVVFAFLIGSVYMQSNEFTAIIAKINSLNTVNVLFKGPEIAHDIQKIVVKIHANTQNASAPAFNLAGLCNFTSALISKNALLRSLFFTEPVRVTLVNLESAVNANLFEKNPTDPQNPTYDNCLNQAITTYSN